jgi:hypothetical protein
MPMEYDECDQPNKCRTKVKKRNKKIVVYPKCGLLHHFQFQNMLWKNFQINIQHNKFEREREHVLGFKLLLTTAPSHHGFKLHALLSVHLTSKKLSMYNSHIGARKEKKKRRKISWAATAQVLAGGIAKSAHVCLLESLVLSKRKKTLPSFRGNHQNLDAELGPT